MLPRETQTDAEIRAGLGVRAQTGYRTVKTGNKGPRDRGNKNSLSLQKSV